VFSDLLGLTLAVYFFPVAEFFGAVGRVITASRGGLPRWLGAWAYLVAAASVLVTPGMFVDWSPLAPGGVLTLAVLSLQFLWWLAASGVLLLRPVPAAVVRA
jgi:hypothetical protein